MKNLKFSDSDPANPFLKIYTEKALIHTYIYTHTHTYIHTKTITSVTFYKSKY